MTDETGVPPPVPDTGSSSNPYTSPLESSGITSTAAAFDSSTLTSDDKLWALLSHLAGFFGYAVGFGQILLPLIVYMIYKDKSKFVAFHALQSLFFQLAAMGIHVLVGIFAVFTCGIGAVLFAVTIPGAMIYAVIAAIKAYNGEMFEYIWVGKIARNTVGI